MDADTPGLHPQYLALLIDHLQRDGYSKDFYRQCGRFPLPDLRKYPLLHAMDFLWTDTIRAISENSDSAWTAGAGILVSANAHASAGGVFPFRFARGVDEDLRIGIHARALRGIGETQGQGQIETPLFEIDPRRVVLVIGDLLETLRERNFDGNSVLTRDLHDIATLLKSYLDFNSTEIRGQNSPCEADLSWLTDADSFSRKVPFHVIEIIANSYRELVRVELSLDIAKRTQPFAASLYKYFARGNCAYSVMRGKYNNLELAATTGGIRRAEAVKPEELRSIFDAASDKATVLMAQILRARGIECTTHAVDSSAPGRNPGDTIPSAIRITATDGYREHLISLLS